MSLGEIVRRVFSRFVVLSLLICSIFGAGISYGLIASYRSHAVVWCQESLSDFRTLQAQVNSLRIFDRYDTVNKEISGGGVRSLVVSSDNWISPIFRLSKKDAKELVALKEPAGLSDLVGYEINASASNPEMAREKVDFLVNYVSDAALKIKIDEFIVNSLASKRLLLTSAAFEEGSEAYKLSLLESRLSDLKRIALTYPTIATTSDRQILSIEKNGERYMPLPMQMIAVERERFDIKEKLLKTQREVEGLPYEKAMLEEHEKISQQINSGKALALALIKDIQARVPIARKGYEMIVLLGYEDRYSKMVTNSFTASRFIVAPTLPEKPVKSPLLITVVFAIFGVLLAVLWQFRDLIFRLVNEQPRFEKSENIVADASSDVKRLYRA